MVKKILIVLASIIILGLIAWYLGKNYAKNPSKNSSETTQNNNSGDISSLISEEKKDEDTKEKILFASEKEQVKEILVADFNGENKKVVYTDADEENKIKMLGGLAYLSNEVLAFVGPGDSIEGKLETLKTDGSGKKEIIIDSFGKPSSLEIAPDGKSIAFVFFSNVEEDYGFGIYTMARDGSNRRLILKNDHEIKGIAWNKDASQIVFIQSTGSGKTEIQVVNITTTKSKTIYSTDETIPALSWNQAGKIVFSQYNKDKTGGQIIAFDENGSNQIKMLEVTDGVAYGAFLSSENLNMAFLQVQLKEGKIEENSNGTVEAARSSGKNLQKISGGFSILGWAP